LVGTLKASVTMAKIGAGMPPPQENLSQILPALS
jgi:hypothetical protein